MGFEGRKKGKYIGVEKFIEKMKEIQGEAKAALGKALMGIKRFDHKTKVKARSER